MADNQSTGVSDRLTFTIAELVKAAPGLSRTRIYQALKDRELGAKKLGKRTLIPRDEATRFLANLPDYEAAA